MQLEFCLHPRATTETHYSLILATRIKSRRRRRLPQINIADAALSRIGTLELIHKVRKMKIFLTERILICAQLKTKK